LWSLDCGGVMVVVVVVGKGIPRLLPCQYNSMSHVRLLHGALMARPEPCYSNSSQLRGSRCVGGEGKRAV
jgi:hypothetical protein